MVIVFVSYYLFATLVTANVLIATIIDLQLSLTSKEKELKKAKQKRAGESLSESIQEIENEEAQDRKDRESQAGDSERQLQGEANQKTAEEAMDAI